MAMLLGAAPGTDIVLSEERMLSARAFANKIWNAARFIFLNMERSGVEPWVPEECISYRPETVGSGPEGVPLEDRWIFSRLNSCADLVNRAIDRYRYHEAAQLLWQFFWHEFCDWYLEIKKLRFTDNSGQDANWRNVLTVFEASLRLLHPVMPFLTEEIWQRLAKGTPGRPISIALGQYPQYDIHVTDHPAEREMQILQEIVTAARNLRADMGANPKEQLEGVLYSQSGAADVAGKQADAIQKLANIKLEIRSEAAPAGVQGVKRSTTEFDLVLRISQAQVAVQHKRLEKEIEQLEKVIANSERQLANERFLARAPEQVVNSIRQKLSEYRGQLAKSRAAQRTKNRCRPSNISAVSQSFRAAISPMNANGRHRRPAPPALSAWTWSSAKKSPKRYRCHEKSRRRGTAASAPPRSAVFTRPERRSARQRTATTRMPFVRVTVESAARKRAQSARPRRHAARRFSRPAVSFFGT
jgi:valyl-tRNA synthetase